MRPIIPVSTLILSLVMFMGHAKAQAGNEQFNSNKIDQTFQNVIEKLDGLPDRLGEQQRRQKDELKEMLKNMKGTKCPQLQANDGSKGILKRELKKLSTLQQNLLKKLDVKCQTGVGLIPFNEEAANEIEDATEVDSLQLCSNIYTKTLEQLSNNITLLQNIDKRLRKFSEQYYAESGKHNKTLEAAQGLFKFLIKKEDYKICIKSDGQQLICTDEPHPTSCADSGSSYCSNNKCLIKNILYGTETFLVACDEITDGGGWTVIQRRLNGSVDFFRNWSDYKTGFGNLDGEFWIGLDKLHALTTTLAPVELLIQLTDHDDIMRYAKYGMFAIGSEEELYELKEIDDYKGNAGNSLANHKGRKFSTKDKDNDSSYTYNCAELKKGGWWYDKCLWTNLNGFYYKTATVPKNETGAGINWFLFHGYEYSLKSVQMMIRTKRQ